MAQDRTSDFKVLVQSLPDAERLRAGPTSITSSSSSSAQHQQQSVASYTTGRYGSSPSSNNAAITKSAQQQQKQSSYSQELRNFHKTAATISSDIAITSKMLSELTLLVQSKSLFVDDSTKINSLVIRIKSSIENLNSRLDEANTIIQYQKRLLGKNSQQGQEAMNVVTGLQDEFAIATSSFKKVLQARTDNLKNTTDQKRLVYGSSINTSNVSETSATSTTTDPSLVSLENKPHVYNNNNNNEKPNSNNTNLGGSSSNNNSGMKASSNASFPTIDLTSGYNGGMMAAGESTASGGGGGFDSLPRPYGSSGGHEGIRLRHQHADVPTFSGGSSSISSSYYNCRSNNANNNSGYPMSPLDIQRMEQQSGQDQMMQLIPDQNYLRERADAMSMVESNILELGAVFNKLAVMVNEHRDMVQRIDDNVDDANSTINLSMETLTKTLTDLRTNRTLFLKVFGILVLFVILFITFFA